MTYPTTTLHTQDRIVVADAQIARCTSQLQDAWKEGDSYRVECLTDRLKELEGERHRLAMVAIDENARLVSSETEARCVAAFHELAKAHGVLSDA